MMGNGKTSNKLVSEKSVISTGIEFEDSYLFNWDYIPGDDSDRFMEFLVKNYKLNWVKTAKLNKTDNNMIINVSHEMNSLSLKLNNEKTNATLKIGDGRTDNFVAITESGRLKIYPQEQQNLIIDLYLESRDLDPRFKYWEELKQFHVEVEEIIKDLELKKCEEELEKTAKFCAETYHTRKDEITKAIEATKNTKSQIWIGLGLILTPMVSAILSELGKWAWSIVIK